MALNRLNPPTPLKWRCRFSSASRSRIDRTRSMSPISPPSRKRAASRQTRHRSTSKPPQRVQEDPSLTDESKFRDPPPSLPSKNGHATIGKADGSYVIQVVASKERAKVEKMRQKLAAQGYRAYLEPQGEFTRLIVGFFPRESDAVTEKKRIDKVLRSDRVNCWVRKR